VTDANGCTLDQDVIVGQANNTLAIAPAVTAASCTAATGAITLNVSGGVAPLTYAWSNGASTADLANIAGGTYHITVTDANGCTLDQDVIVGQANNTLAVAPAVTAASCTAPTGAITLNVSGGVAPLTFAWSNGATTADLTNIAGGTYHITVTDANGCTLDQDVIVGQANNTLAVAPAVTRASCTAATGAITLNVSGGVAPLTYAWSNGASTPDLANLAAGTYHITVTDANGCTLDQDVIVGQANNTLAVAPA